MPTNDRHDSTPADVPPILGYGAPARGTGVRPADLLGGLAAALAFALCSALAIAMVALAVLEFHDRKRLPVFATCAIVAASFTTLAILAGRLAHTLFAGREPGESQ